MAFGCREMCPMNAVADWHLSQVMGERVGPLHTMIGQEAFTHLPAAPGILARHSFLLALH